MRILALFLCHYFRVEKWAWTEFESKDGTFSKEDIANELYNTYAKMGRASLGRLIRGLQGTYKSNRGLAKSRFQVLKEKAKAETLI